MKNENTWKSRKKMSKLLGTLRKKGKKGTYYYHSMSPTSGLFQGRFFTERDCHRTGMDFFQRDMVDPINFSLVAVDFIEKCSLI